MASLVGKITTAFGILMDSGVSGLGRRVAERKRARRQKKLYQRWLKVRRVSNEQLISMAAGLKYAPLISVVLPVYNVDEKWLRLCIESVRNQIYRNWELCIADDASPSPHVRAVLQEYAAKDPRIKLEMRAENGHISAASNTALALASGDFVVLLDHDDELSVDALFWVANEVNAYPEAAIIYSDEDLIDERGNRFAPKFKPDFSRDLLYSLNLMTHLSCYRTDLIREVGGFRAGTEGSQDYDLELRAIEKVGDDKIRHIPRVLYHWRVIRGSVAFSMDEKPYAHERARDAIRDHFKRSGIRGEVLESFRNLHRVTYKDDDHLPSIALVVSGDQATEDVSRQTGVADTYETVTVPVGGDRAALLNEAAARAKADVLVFLDADVRFVESDAINALASFALQPNIGAVGGRIIGSDLYVEQAGVVLGSDLSPAFAHNGYTREDPGNMFRNLQVSNFSAITLACMAIRREMFDELGGFDDSIAALFDIDLCLRLWLKKKRVVVVPHIELIRRRRLNQPTYRREELEQFRMRWSQFAAADPFCNPNLKRDGSFEIDA